MGIGVKRNLNQIIVDISPGDSSFETTTYTFGTLTDIRWKLTTQTGDRIIVDDDSAFGGGDGRVTVVGDVDTIGDINAQGEITMSATPTGSNSLIRMQDLDDELLMIQIPENINIANEFWPRDRLVGFNAYLSNGVTNGFPGNFYTGISNIVSRSTGATLAQDGFFRVGNCGFQLAVQWDNNGGTVPEHPIIRVLDDTSTTWSDWREIAWLDELPEIDTITGNLDVQGTLSQQGIPVVAEYGTPGTVLYNLNNDREFDFIVQTGRYVDNDADLQQQFTGELNFTEVFNEWFRFEHNAANGSPNNPASNQPPFVGEQNTWVLDPGPAIRNTTNSSRFIGFVSNETLDNFTIKTQLSSPNADDDHIGIVIAFVPEGVPGQPGYIEHTLTAWRSNGGAGPSPWSIQYNALSTTASFNDGLVVDGSSLVTNVFQTPQSGWQQAGVGCPVEVRRTSTSVACFTGEMGTTTINPSTLIQVNFSDFPELEIFSRPARYGFSAFSQQNATFSNINVFPAQIFDTANDAIYDFDINGFVYTLVSGSVTDQEGIGRLLHDQNTGKTFYSRSVGDIPRIIGTNLSTSELGERLGSFDPLTEFLEFTLNPSNIEVVDIRTLFGDSTLDPRTVIVSALYEDTTNRWVVADPATISVVHDTNLGNIQITNNDTVARNIAIRFLR